MDFFTVEVLTLARLVRYSVLFVIDVATRRVHIAGIARAPDGRWMQQVARNLTDAIDGVLRGTRYLIHDRDPLFTREFDGLLRAAGVKCLKLPARSPDLNAYAERFVLSIKSECLWKIIPLGEGLCAARTRAGRNMRAVGLPGASTVDLGRCSLWIRCGTEVT